jgi:hypothetical protein
MEFGITACRRVLSQAEAHELIELLKVGLHEIEALESVAAANEPVAAVAEPAPAKKAKAPAVKATKAPVAKKAKAPIAKKARATAKNATGRSAG